jgi:putative cardiolipin synthase
VVQSLPPATSGVIAESALRFARLHPPNQSGFLALLDNQQALTWRLGLVDHAVASIDVQYFIWQDDAAGIILFDRLLKAADRGVRVRMLVDDFLLEAKGHDIAAITTHPNFDIKIYNPGIVRESALGGIGEFLLYFKELNRRMHNKLFVVDGQMAIVGGRNIGDAYFGISEKYNFRDLDVLVVGSVIGELTGAFDQFWNTEIAYPGSAMSKKATFADFEKNRQSVRAYLAAQQHLLASFEAGAAQMTDRIRQIPDVITTGQAHFIQDEPVSFDGREHRLVDMLDYIAEPSRSELIMVSPYLIPVKGTLEELADAESSGVDVKLLTGSMGANNHTVAHSHYKKYRRPIMETGADLYEFRHDPSAAMRDISDVPPVEAQFICLHIKAIVADKARCFVGSLNLDPRAIEINTENGLYIDSRGFCGQLAAAFDTMMAPENAWRVYLNEDNYLRWESSAGTAAIQPARSFWQRIADFFFRLLPIESQL